jgi:hypothetical protein
MFESLRSHSDHKILTDTDAIIVQDRKLTLRLLVHLHEIERRKLHLTRGYGSMFVYCTTQLRCRRQPRFAESGRLVAWLVFRSRTSETCVGRVRPATPPPRDAFRRRTRGPEAALGAGPSRW